MSYKIIWNELCEILGTKKKISSHYRNKQPGLNDCCVLLAEQIRDLQKRVDYLEKRPHPHVPASIYGPGDNNYGRD